MNLGSDLVDVDAVVAHAAAPGPIEIDPASSRALLATERLAAGLAARSSAYGRTTGVGANRNVVADDRDGGHGLRLVRSHAAGAGPDLGVDVARATMLIRAHQLCTPGSGIPLHVVQALVAASADDRTPLVREFGGVGTGDITALAELALCLLGEHPWRDGTTHRYLEGLDAGSALAFMSSSAPTLAVAALAAAELRALARSSISVAALSLAAVRANPQHWSAAAERTRPSSGVSAICGGISSVLDGSLWTSSRTQDPLSFRCVPFVGGPLWQSVDELVREVDSCISAAVENPRYVDGAVWHHGAFMLTSLSLQLDVTRLAMTQWLSTSHARLVKLMDPSYSRGENFLADGPAGSSGVMVLEYAASSALETARTLADPVSRHTVTISIGTEDHASFTSRAVVAARQMVDAARVVVACELIAAVRALRAADDVDLGEPAAALLHRCRSLPTDTADRPLVGDISLAVRLLDELVIAR
jgi:histidine ammonia-lyase